jgi:MOSC domain-containing protein YiiM
MSPLNGEMAKLLATLPQRGALEKILLRPERRAPMVSATEAQVIPGRGLVGDRFRGRPDSKRQVTLIQAENLAVLASLLHVGEIDPAVLRRNLVVRGISLNALKGRRFKIGNVVLEGTAPCDPCSRMEELLGPGGFNAMRGIGGLCARVIEGGELRVGDAVCAWD